MSNEREQLIARLRRFAVVLEARGETYDAETCEQAIASLSAPHDNNAPASEHPMLEPTHICKDCGVPWRQCDDFTFNLRGAKACPACDNTPVGGQLVSITAPLVREINRLRALSAPQAGYVRVPNDEVLRVARLIEALKLPCGESPESPQAIRNGQYMSLALIMRDWLAAAPQPPAEPRERVLLMRDPKGSPLWWQSTLDTPTAQRLGFAYRYATLDSEEA